MACFSNPAGQLHVKHLEAINFVSVLRVICKVLVIVLNFRIFTNVISCAYKDLNFFSFVCTVHRQERV